MSPSNPTFGVAISELALLPLGLVAIELFKKKVTHWHVPSGVPMDAVSYYRALVVGLSTILILTDWANVRQLLQLLGS